MHILQHWDYIVPVTVWCNDAGISNNGKVRITHRRDQFPFLSEVPPEYYCDMVARAKKMQEQNRYLSLDMCIKQAENKWLIEVNYIHGYRTWESPIKRLFRSLYSTRNKNKCNFICTCQRKSVPLRLIHIHIRLFRQSHPPRCESARVAFFLLYPL